MPTDHEMAAPAELARIEVVSPWLTATARRAPRRWLAHLVAIWREAMELYGRATMYGRTSWRF